MALTAAAAVGVTTARVVTASGVGRWRLAHTPSTASKATAPKRDIPVRRLPTPSLLIDVRVARTAPQKSESDTVHRTTDEQKRRPQWFRLVYAMRPPDISMTKGKRLRSKLLEWEIMQI